MQHTTTLMKLTSHQKPHRIRAPLPPSHHSPPFTSEAFIMSYAPITSKTPYTSKTPQHHRVPRSQIHWPPPCPLIYHLFRARVLAKPQGNLNSTPECRGTLVQTHCFKLHRNLVFQCMSERKVGGSILLD